MRIIPDPDGWQRRYAAELTQAGWTCHRPGQGCIGSDHAYKGKTDTSEDASVHVLPRTGTLRWKVYDHLRLHGPATDYELQTSLGLIGSSERPRRRELVQGGFVQDSGERKKHHGENFIIWEVVDYASADAI